MEEFAGSLLVDRQSAVSLLGQNAEASKSNGIQLKTGRVRCHLTIKYQKSSREKERVLSVLVDIQCRDLHVFEDLFQVAAEELGEATGLPMEAFYVKLGRFRMIQLDSEKTISHEFLDSNCNWKEHASLALRDQLVGDPDGECRVEIEFVFSSVQILPIAGKGFAESESVRRALQTKMRKNWEGKWYVPARDLGNIMSNHTVAMLIREDSKLKERALPSQNFGITGVDALIARTNQVGHRLLATCVYAKVSVLYLGEILKSNLTDDNLSLSEEDCRLDKRYLPIFNRLVAVSGAFCGRSLGPKLEHAIYKQNDVMPIIFGDTSDPVLGRGPFSTVTRVRIDRHHHRISLTDEPYALKKFDALSGFVQQMVNHERGTYEDDVQHPNLTYHLLSWSHAGSDYILSPLADCNLRTYIRIRNSPRWTKSNLTGLIGQMRGLADALRYIHELEYDNYLKYPTDSHLDYHHGLSHYNILVNTDPATNQPIFSIDDFRTAKIKQIRSKPSSTNSLPRPNPEATNTSYTAPDLLLDGKISRPYDLWSLGCIFLDLLTWIVGAEHDSVIHFTRRRLHDSAPGTNAHDQGFWWLNADGDVQLKDSVKNQFRFLKGECAGRGVFPHLVHIVARLLTIDSSKRTKAPDLILALDAVVVQMDLDLEDDIYYSDPPPPRPDGPRHIVASPPASSPDSMGERRASVDESVVRPVRR